VLGVTTTPEVTVMRLVATVVCVLSVALAVALSGAASAEARSCGDLSVRGYHRIEVHNGVTCRGAKRKIRRWSSQGFPRDPVGWFCQMGTRRKLCSKGNGDAPYFTFARQARGRHARALGTGGS
jgi:hypothetical protein